MPTSPCDRRLRRWYRAFNVKWWAGELPEDVEVFFGTCEKDHGMYAYSEDYLDEKVSGFELCVDHRWVDDDRIAKWWLLHEMAHLAVMPFAGHGDVFQNEMKRLAQAGAFKGIW